MLVWCSMALCEPRRRNNSNYQVFKEKKGNLKIKSKEMNCHYLIIYIFAFWIIVVVITGEKRLLSIPCILWTQNRNNFFMKITSKKISIEFYANHQQLTKNDEKETFTNKQKNKRQPRRQRQRKSSRKKWMRTVSNVIAIIPTVLIFQMMAIFFLELNC